MKSERGKRMVEMKKFNSNDVSKGERYVGRARKVKK